MSIIAPVHSLIGLGPLSHCLSAYELAVVVPPPSPRNTISTTQKQLTLKGLLQYENVQTIQANLAVLARFAHHLPRDVSDSTTPVGDDELVIMGQLVRDISSSLEKIGSLREEDEMLPGLADKYVPVRPVSFLAKRRRRERMKMKLVHKCHSCSRLETPQWRPGPDGPRTLCNVCGLVYTKRQRRHADQMVKAAREE